MTCCRRCSSDSASSGRSSIGHSDGASIALLHAGGGHPVAGLVLLAPHVFVEDRSIDGIAAARAAYETPTCASGWPATTSTSTPRSAAGTTCGCRTAFRSWDITDRLAAIDVPVLVVQGTDDQYGSLAQLDAIEARRRPARSPASSCPTSATPPTSTPPTRRCAAVADVRRHEDR